MMNIALGQYYPSNSAIHRLDSRSKVIMAVLYMVCAFLCKSFISFMILFASSVILILISKIPLKIIFKAIKPLIFIMLFTAVINIFFASGKTVIWEWGILHVSVEGLWNALFMVIRILVLILGTCVFMTYTTTPIELTDAIDSLLSPLKKIHVPVHEFAMMTSIALRFIPTLAEETDKVMAAQKSRGADFESGGLIHRAKALIPVLIPLFVSAFRIAADLATAMECRCYRGGEGRTRLNVPHMKFSDFAAMLMMVLLGTGLVFANRLDMLYVM